MANITTEVHGFQVTGLMQDMIKKLGPNTRHIIMCLQGSKDLLYCYRIGNIDDSKKLDDDYSRARGCGNTITFFKGL